MERGLRLAGLRKGRETELLELLAELRSGRETLVQALHRVLELRFDEQLRVQVATVRKQEAAAAALQAAEQRSKDQQEWEAEVERREAARAEEWRRREEVWVGRLREAAERAQRDTAKDMAARSEQAFEAFRDKCMQRVEEARRGADARVATMEKRAAALHSSSSERAGELEAELAGLRRELGAKLQVAEDTHRRDEGRIAELEAALAQARSGLKQNQADAERAARETSARREEELSELDQRVRKAMNSKQALIERLREERDANAAEAREAKMLLQQLESGLQPAVGLRR